MKKNGKVIPFRPRRPSPEEERERAFKVAKIKEKVRTGAYLIQTEEIIEGLLDAMMRAVD